MHDSIRCYSINNNNEKNISYLSSSKDTRDLENSFVIRCEIKKDKTPKEKNK